MMRVRKARTTTTCHLLRVLETTTTSRLARWTMYKSTAEYKKKIAFSLCTYAGKGYRDLLFWETERTHWRSAPIGASA